MLRGALLWALIDAQRVCRVQVWVAGGVGHDVAAAAPRGDEPRPGGGALNLGSSLVQAGIKQLQARQPGLVHVLLQAHIGVAVRNALDRDLAQLHLVGGEGARLVAEDVLNLQAGRDTGSAGGGGR